MSDARGPDLPDWPLERPADNAMDDLLAQLNAAIERARRECEHPLDARGEIQSVDGPVAICTDCMQKAPVCPYDRNHRAVNKSSTKWQCADCFAEWSKTSG